MQFVRNSIYGMLIFIATITTVYSQTIDDLPKIAEFSEKQCGAIPTGKWSRTTITGKIKGDAAGLAKLGFTVSGDGQFKREDGEYVNPPFENLPDKIPTVAMCKVEVTKLVTEMLKKKK